MENNLYDIFSLSSPDQSPKEPLKGMISDQNGGVYGIDFNTLGVQNSAEQSVESPAPVTTQLGTRSLKEIVITPEPTHTEPAVEQATNGIEIELSEIPEAIILSAEQALLEVLEINPKPRLRTAQLIVTAFGSKRVPSETVYLFKQALRHNTKLRFLGDGEFEVIERTKIENSSDWLRSWSVDIPELEAMKETILTAARDSLRLRTMTEHDITTIIKRMGVYILNEELDALISLIASDLRIKVNRDGNFTFRDAPEIQNSHRESSPLTSRQVKRALTMIDRSSAVREAHDLGKNLADPRGRRKKYSRKSGRGQGKKKTFEQIIMEINKKSDQGTTST